MNIEQLLSRVEGRGAATIHDVTVGFKDPQTFPKPQTSAKLEELLEQSELLSLAVARATKTMAALDAYFSSVKLERDGSSNLASIFDDYNTATEKYDLKVFELRKKLKKIEDEIKTERVRLGVDVPVKINGNRSGTVTVNVFAEEEGEVELVVIYGKGMSHDYLLVHYN